MDTLALNTVFTEFSVQFMNTVFNYEYSVQL